MPAEPDTFAAKCAYWRTNGAPGITYSQGKDHFHNSTVSEDIRNTLAVAKADGRVLERVGPPAAVPVSSLGVL